MNSVLRIGAVSLFGLLAGCATMSGNTAPSSGSAKATKLSALGGGLIGGSIGQDLASADRRKALEAEYQALEYTQGGKAVTWSGGKGTDRGEVVAAQPYQVGSQNCRQYVHTLYTGNSSQTVRGTACRNTDGSWSLLN